jgi:hypothetical protein
VVVQDNTLLDSDLGPVLVEHSGEFGPITYSRNRYSSTAAAGDWFAVDGQRLSLDEWRAAAGEADATGQVEPPPAPERCLETYCTEVLGVPGEIEAFIAAAMGQSRHHWRPELTATAVNDYIRAGFGW